MKYAEIGSIAIADIVVPPRLRGLDPDIVEVIAADLRAGKPLLHPITVRAKGNQVVLTAGWHRLEAHKKEGLKFIPAHVLEDGHDDDDYLAIEAMENLGRKDLTVLDRAVHLGALLKIEQAKGHEYRKGGDRKSDRRKSFPLIGEMAETMKVSRRTINNYMALAKGLSPKVVERLKGTDLVDNYSELAALAVEISPDDQADVLDLYVAGKSPNIRAASALHHNQVDTTSPDEKAFAAFVKLWGRASKKVRRQIVNHVTKAEKQPR